MAKLVDILARELKEWPMAFGSVYRTEAIAQDLDGGLVRLDHLKQPSPIQFDGEDWCRNCWTGYANCMELSEDYSTAIVTRAEWQAAVDALKAKKAKSESLVDDYVESQAERYAKEWDGVGLPPVGTVCEIKLHAAWTPVEVIAHYANQAVIGWNCPEGENVELRCVGDLRPIRTPKQIAAEEREKFIDELIKVTCIRRGEAGLIYDAGYRKQEPK